MNPDPIRHTPVVFLVALSFLLGGLAFNGMATSDGHHEPHHPNPAQEGEVDKCLLNQGAPFMGLIADSIGYDADSEIVAVEAGSGFVIDAEGTVHIAWMDEQGSRELQWYHGGASGVVPDGSGAGVFAVKASVCVSLLPYGTEAPHSVVPATGERFTYQDGFPPEDGHHHLPGPNSPQEGETELCVRNQALPLWGTVMGVIGDRADPELVDVEAGTGYRIHVQEDRYVSVAFIGPEGTRSLRWGDSGVVPDGSNGEVFAVKASVCVSLLPHATETPHIVVPATGEPFTYQDGFLDGPE